MVTPIFTPVSPVGIVKDRFILSKGGWHFDRCFVCAGQEKFSSEMRSREVFLVGILNEVFEGQTQEYDRKFDNFVVRKRV
jgi:hypothetical protein